MIEWTVSHSMMVVYSVGVMVQKGKSKIGARTIQRKPTKMVRDLENKLSG